MAYLCESCGGNGVIQDGVRCSACGLRRFVLTAERGEFKLTLFPVGFTVEGDPSNPLGRRVESRPASGGASNSFIAPDGSFNASLSGHLERGRSNEPHVIKVLLTKLRELGHHISTEDHARDHFGEDGILIVDGRRIPLQIITVPNDSSLWKKLHMSDAAAISGNFEKAVSVLREAITAKSLKGSGTILALDLTHFGALAGPIVVAAYVASYGDPVVEFSFRSVWLVGPSIRSTIELRPQLKSV